jgi:hypothetical protein
MALASPNNNAVISTFQFEQAWGDGDSHPPPGFDFAAALEKSFYAKGMGKFESPTIDPDQWEHTYWYFWIQLEGNEYFVTVESTMTPETKPGIWRVCFSRRLGFWRSFFDKADQLEMSAELRSCADQLIRDTASPQTIDWLTDSQAEQMLG